MADDPKNETESSAVWKALSDPTRRAILDKLRMRPITTGELATEFPSSRFAVMKHLQVLVDAGLVIVERQGRERWNHLNSIPLQAMYERWVKPYEAHWAESLLRLKNRLENDQGETSMSENAVVPVRELGAETAQVELEIVINASAERVWRALVEETPTWWPKKHMFGKNVERFVIEPRLGGLVYEDWGKGAGAVWYTVMAVDAPRRLECWGHISPECGGPTQTYLRLNVEEADGATRLRVSDTLSGKVGEKMAAETRAGWNDILGTSLKAFVEGSGE